MRSSIFYAIGFAGLAAAIAEPAEEDDYSTTITIRVTSTVVSVKYTATETVTGTPPPDAYQTGDILSQVTMPASTLKTMSYGSSASATAAAEPGFSNSASSMLRSQEVIIAGAVSALSMVYALI